MKLTNEEALSILSALISLDGHDRIVKNGQEERIVKDVYKFGGLTRLAIARNINTLTPTQDAYLSARNSVVRELSNGAGFIAAGDSASAAKLAEEEIKLLRASSGELSIIKIKIDDLNLDENSIPSSKLAILLPILE